MSPLARPRANRSRPKPAGKPSKADVVTGFRRSQVLDAARECFATHGLTGTTVDGIARGAGVAKGTVYLYYKSKEDILRQVLDEDLAQLQQDTVPMIAAASAIEDRLQRFFANTLAFFDRKRDFFEHVHFEMGAAVRKVAEQKLEVVYKAQISSWQAALKEAQKAGQIGPQPVAAAALTIVALSSGLAKHRLRGWATGPIEDMAAHASATLWKGLSAK